MRQIASIAAFILAGCASTADIDLSKVETQCGQKCSASYSDCSGSFTFMPIAKQNSCVDALRVCASACPPR